MGPQHLVEVEAGVEGGPPLGLVASDQPADELAAETAQRAGGEPTVFIDNLIMDAPGDGRSLEDMVAATGRGLLVTCLWYIREVDPQNLLLTGLTRDGVFLVEGGEVVGAVNNFRFNESPVDVLGRVAESGRTDACLPREWNDFFTRTAMPTLRVSDFNMSTVSQAL